MARRGLRLGFLLPGLLVLAAPRSPVSGQDVLEGLQSLAMENAELYVAPLADGLGIAMGTGFARTGRVHGILGFSIGVRVVAALPSEEAGTFTPILPESVTFRGVTFSNPYEPASGVLTSATVVGDGPGVVLRPRGEYLAAIQLAGENPDDYTLAFPDGLDLPAVPFAVVEGALGMGMGTEITARFLPSYEIASEVGAVSARGFGVRHSLTSWIPGPTPLLDLAVYAGWQRFQVGDYLDANAVAYGLGRAGSPRLVAPLAAFVRNEREQDLSRAFAVIALGLLGEKDPGLPPFARFAIDSHYELRVALLDEVRDIL